jgi:hypothetical protein
MINFLDIYPALSQLRRKSQRLLQFRVLRFGLLQYRDVGVGCFPKGVSLIRAFCYFDSCSSRTSES